MLYKPILVCVHVQLYDDMRKWYMFSSPRNIPGHAWWKRANLAHQCYVTRQIWRYLSLISFTSFHRLIALIKGQQRGKTFPFHDVTMFKLHSRFDDRNKMKCNCSCDHQHNKNGQLISLGPIYCTKDIGQNIVRIRHPFRIYMTRSWYIQCLQATLHDVYILNLLVRSFESIYQWHSSGTQTEIMIMR